MRTTREMVVTMFPLSCAHVRAHTGHETFFGHDWADVSE